jgi:vacuolar-type H+-ATPase subunit E/Vma4
MQEATYNVIEKVAAMQSMVKKIVQESEEKLKTHITAETTEGIAQKETKARENITTARETFHNFMETWKKALSGS